MYRRVIYDFIWFRDARRGFEVFGEILVVTVKKQTIIGFCYSNENTHGKINSDQEQWEDYVLCESKVNTVEKVNVGGHFGLSTFNQMKFHLGPNN